ncbi:nucleotide disphospho-sugar-binding domain-containing protein [Amycolatopsis anabasis]|uniref:nucleotide disphospho-sugar-binding domain-containing protein n=1 Tax=Amycolatopsis anabasis TaxID=1840409 RepID=UPI00131D9C17|nr:nucleotide disphospho-sugar-binding domain-containing protein [Amycolatopsis anabasis]
MRVMFVIWPNPSHLYPLVPLAWALQGAGHEVCVASHPEIAPSTAASGLAAVSLGDPELMPVPMGPGRAYREEREKVARITEALALDPADREDWDIFSQFMLPAMWDFHPYQAPPEEPRPTMDAMVEFARSWRPDLVLWDPCVPGGAVAARACGAAQARWWTGPDYFAVSMEKFQERTTGPGAVKVDNPLAETVRPVAERYGVEMDDDILLGQWTVTPVPEGMRPHTRTLTIPVRWIPYSGQAVLPDWLYPLPERPRVGLSLGLSWRKYLKGGWDHIPGLLDAVSDLDIEVVATLNETQLADVTRIPDNVRAVDYVPLNQLLPTCAAFIHHGGFASYAAAAALKVPQLVTDSSDSDVAAVVEKGGMGATKHAASPATVRHVVERGAGVALDIGSPSLEGTRKQIARVLNEPAFQDGAARVYQDFLATPAPNDVVPTLERLTAQHRG